jgi:hypothetical protein
VELPDFDGGLETRLLHYGTGVQLPLDWDEDADALAAIALLRRQAATVAGKPDGEGLALARSLLQLALDTRAFSGKLQANAAPLVDERACDSVDTLLASLRPADAAGKLKEATASAEGLSVDLSTQALDALTTILHVCQLLKLQLEAALVQAGCPVPAARSEAPASIVGEEVPQPKEHQHRKASLTSRPSRVVVEAAWPVGLPAEEPSSVATRTLGAVDVHALLQAAEAEGDIEALAHVKVRPRLRAGLE